MGPAVIPTCKRYSLMVDDLCEQVLPFSLMVFLASSMSHVEAAQVQVAYRNARYLWPGFPGTRLRILHCIAGLGRSVA